MIKKPDYPDEALHAILKLSEEVEELRYWQAEAMNKINEIKEKLENTISLLKVMPLTKKLSKNDNAYLIAVGRASAYQKCLEIFEREVETEEWFCCNANPPENFKQVRIRDKKNKAEFRELWELNKDHVYFTRFLSGATSNFKGILKDYEWSYIK